MTNATFATTFARVDVIRREVAAYWGSLPTERLTPAMLSASLRAKGVKRPCDHGAQDDWTAENISNTLGVAKRAQVLTLDSRRGWIIGSVEKLPPRAAPTFSNVTPIRPSVEREPALPKVTAEKLLSLIDQAITDSAMIELSIRQNLRMESKLDRLLVELGVDFVNDMSDSEMAKRMLVARWEQLHPGQTYQG